LNIHKYPFYLIADKMSTHKEYALIAILATAAIVGVGPAFGFCPPTCESSSEYTNAMMTGNASSLSAVQQPENIIPLTLTTDKTTYDHASVIMVSGHVINPYPGQDVAMKLSSPEGNVVFVSQLSLDSNGNFNTTINTSSSLMTENGQYTLYAQQGNEQARTNQVQFQLTGQIPTTPSIPEFGPTAALVLAIAIISIIAVSAKTGLRLMPKY
jgi:predicted secreted protein with PEFG-CTERM motif